MFHDFNKVQFLLDLCNNPFNCDVTKYEFEIQAELIILRSEFIINKINITEFWQNLDHLLYPELKRNYQKCLSFFPSTYLGEQIF